jgi:hypothetical protein
MDVIEALPNTRDFTLFQKFEDDSPAHHGSYLFPSHDTMLLEFTNISRGRR